jgi:hypothetical protein
MSIIRTENSTHRAACAAAEAVRQATSQTTQATAAAADIAFYRTCLASAIVNSCATAQFETALKELGTGGT